MPWHVKKTEACPTSKPWGVVKDADNTVKGCHETKASAVRQLEILNQIEKSSRPYLEQLWKDEMQAVILASEVEFETILVKLNSSEYTYLMLVADTAERRQVGLSFRHELPFNADGMIFMYSEEDNRILSSERVRMDLIFYSFDGKGKLQSMGSLLKSGISPPTLINSQFIIETTKEDIEVQFLEF